MYPELGSEALFLLEAQSLTWDTFFAEASRISLVVALLQPIQQLAWDTLSHPKISDSIQEISITFYFVCAIGPLGRPSQNILRILAEIPVADSRGSAFLKNLSRCGLLVAYRVEAMK
jgi:hypothetical protein